MVSSVCLVVCSLVDQEDSVLGGEVAQEVHGPVQMVHGGDLEGREGGGGGSHQTSVSKKRILVVNVQLDLDLDLDPSEGYSDVRLTRGLMHRPQDCGISCHRGLPPKGRPLSY